MTKSKTIYLVIFTFISILTHGQETTDTTNIWPYCEYDYAKQYIYNLENSLRSNHAIIKNDTLCSTVVGDAITLQQADIDTLVKIINNSSTIITTGLSKSYVPHHAIIFYNNADSVCAWITMDFCSKQIVIYPEKAECKPIERKITDDEVDEIRKEAEKLSQIISTNGHKVLNSPFAYAIYKKQIDNDKRRKKK